MELLICPCCKNILTRVDNSFKCINKHSFDIATKGYVNLLLANQKHSLDPGDSKDSILSRKAFFMHDYYHLLKKTIKETIIKYINKESFNFIDLACGEGYYTNYIHKELSNNYKINTIGVDISKQAIIEACNKKRQDNLNNINYVIANLFNLPFIDNYFDIALNCFAPIDENEFNRILKSKGLFLRILPDKDHLLGLKEILYENVILNQMKELNLKGFSLIDTIYVKDNIHLKNKEEIQELFKMTPYYYKSPKKGKDKLNLINELDTIISFVILVYQKD